MRKSYFNRPFKIEQQRWLLYGLARADDKLFIIKYLPVVEAGKINGLADEKALQKSNKLFLLACHLQITINSL